MRKEQKYHQNAENSGLTGVFEFVKITITKTTHSDCRKATQWGFILSGYV